MICDDKFYEASQRGLTALIPVFYLFYLLLLFFICWDLATKESSSWVCRRIIFPDAVQAPGAERKISQTFYFALIGLAILSLCPPPPLAFRGGEVGDDD